VLNGPEIVGKLRGSIGRNFQGYGFIVLFWLVLAVADIVVRVYPHNTNVALGNGVLKETPDLTEYLLPDEAYQAYRERLEALMGAREHESEISTSLVLGSEQESALAPSEISDNTAHLLAIFSREDAFAVFRLKNDGGTISVAKFKVGDMVDDLMVESITGNTVVLASKSGDRSVRKLFDLSDYVQPMADFDEDSFGEKSQ